MIDLLELGDRLPRVPPEAPERLAGPISREDLDWYLSTLPNNKAPGPDGLPYEALKFGPECVREAVFQAANTVLTGAAPMPPSWKGGLIPRDPRTAMVTHTTTNGNRICPSACAHA